MAGRSPFRRAGRWSQVTAGRAPSPILASIVTRQPPFWVIGAPRSGTTFLSRVLASHPKIFCTDETRVMTFVNRIVNGLTDDTWILQRHRQIFIDLLVQRLPEIVEEFYGGLGATEDQRWGDKHPSYADARSDPEVLALIDQLFPGSQFIHIIRDGRAVVTSFSAIGFGAPRYACDSWRRHVVHARDFGTAQGSDRYLELRYEDLVNNPTPTVSAMFEFLGVGQSSEVDQLLESQSTRRTPWSAPTAAVDPTSLEWRNRLPPETVDQVERELADLLVELGYEDSAWRRALLSSPPSSAEPPQSWTPAGHSRSWHELPELVGTGRQRLRKQAGSKPAG